MDFIKALPTLGGHTMIMVMVNKLSEYAHFILIIHPYTMLIIT